MDRKIDNILRRGVAEIVFEAEMRRLLDTGKPLRLKQGFDPSRPDIHLGHAVGLRKLRQFQDLGHQLVLIVGDWTAQIGDPSGQSATRTMLSAEQVHANALTYMDQFFKIVDKNRTEVRWQSEWYNSFNLADVIRLTSRFTVAQFLAREDFAKRHAAGQPIAITEMLYPLLQGYDSVVVKADVEFGGIDQKFNCLVARDVQEFSGQRPEQLFLMPLLVGTDGVHKMSKSLGNYVGITEPPSDMYGKIMSIPDHLIGDWFELVTDVSDEEISLIKDQMASQTMNPMIAKKQLARTLVAQFHGEGAAIEAEASFTRVFQKRDLPEQVPDFVFPAGTADPVTLLTQTGLAKSKSDAKRLVTQRAVEIDGEIVTGDSVNVKPGSLLKVGKRRFVRLVEKAS
jgi:tyrosyl-tRNA synthetase